MRKQQLACDSRPDFLARNASEEWIPLRSMDSYREGEIKRTRSKLEEA